MGLRDILKDAMDLAGVPISDRQFMTDYNRAVHDFAMLYDTAKARVSQAISCNNISTEYSLPVGCLKIERVLDSGGNYYRAFTVRGNSKILFADTGTFSISGLFDQTPVDVMTDEVTINAVYLKAIAEYVAAMAIRKSDPDRSKELYGDARNDAEMANRNIRGANNPNRRIYAPSFR